MNGQEDSAALACHCFTREVQKVSTEPLTTPCETELLRADLLVEGHLASTSPSTGYDGLIDVSDV